MMDSAAAGRDGNAHSTIRSASERVSDVQRIIIKSNGSRAGKVAEAEVEARTITESGDAKPSGGAANRGGQTDQRGTNQEHSGLIPHLDFRYCGARNRDRHDGVARLSWRHPRGTDECHHGDGENCQRDNRVLQAHDP
jgi:hypothetical protein